MNATKGPIGTAWTTLEAGLAAIAEPVTGTGQLSPENIALLLQTMRASFIAGALAGSKALIIAMKSAAKDGDEEPIKTFMAEIEAIQAEGVAHVAIEKAAGRFPA